MKHLKLLFRSLLKNDACIEGGRKYKWWVAVIFFLLSTIISVIPITVSVFTADAGVLITSNAYDTDKGFNETLNALKEDNIDLLFFNEKTQQEFDKETTPYMTLDGNWKEEVTVGNQTTRAPYSFSEEVTSEFKVEKVDENGNIIITTETKTEVKEYFRFYVFEELNPQEISDRVLCILQGINPYIVDENGYIKPNEGAELTTSICSFMVFGKENFVFYKYSFDGQATASFSGDYRNTPLHSLTEIQAINEETNQIDYLQTTANLAIFLNDAYYTTKINNGGIQLAIYLSINAGIIIIMGFVLWLMTRGKNNPFNIYKIHECYKIAAWTSFTPAVLGMVMGFLFSGNGLGGFMFVLFYGVRVMWLAMKNLRPMPQR